MAGKNMARRQPSFKRFGTRCTLDVCADQREGSVCGLHPESARWVGAGMARGRLDESPLRQSDPVVPESDEYALEAGTVIALLPVFTDAPWFHEWVSYGKITLLRGKLSYIADAESTVLLDDRWMDPQTANCGDLAGRWMSCLDGLCIGGIYKAA